MYKILDRQLNDIIEAVSQNYESQYLEIILKAVKDGNIDKARASLETYEVIHPLARDLSLKIRDMMEII